MRLGELYALDIVDRFRPQSWGSPTPFHWVLGPLGAALIAAETGVDLTDLSWRRTLAHDLAASQRLAHLVGLNGFFTGLLRARCDVLSDAYCSWPHGSLDGLLARGVMLTSELVDVLSDG
jgi:Replication-relaxation